MSSSNALTMPLTLMLGLSLSMAPAGTLSNVPSTLNYHIESTYQTTSLNTIAQEFGKTSREPRQDAFSLFGVQSNFSIEEQKTYRAMLKENSHSVGINIFDLI